MGGVYEWFAVQQLLGAGRTLLQGRPLSDYIAGDSPVFALIAEARNGSIAVAEPDLALSGPRLQAAHVAIDAAPIAELVTTTPAPEMFSAR